MLSAVAAIITAGVGVFAYFHWLGPVPGVNGLSKPTQVPTTVTTRPGPTVSQRSTPDPMGPIALPFNADGIGGSRIIPLPSISAGHHDVRWHATPPGGGTRGIVYFWLSLIDVSRPYQPTTNTCSTAPPCNVVANIQLVGDTGNLWSWDLSYGGGHWVALVSGTGDFHWSIDIT